MDKININLPENSEQSVVNSSRKMRKIQKKRGANKWSTTQYNKLINLVRLHGEQWETIASNIPNKTAN